MGERVFTGAIIFGIIPRGTMLEGAMPDWIFWAAGSAIVTTAFGAICAIMCLF
jgi:hypothetical protein